MKFFIFAVVLAAVLGRILFLYFSYETQKRISNYIPLPRPGAATTTANVPPATQTGGGATTTPKFVPRGFKGPTGEPHIIGPKDNPPNY